jgi:hypothetical protein
MNKTAISDQPLISRSEGTPREILKALRARMETCSDPKAIFMLAVQQAGRSRSLAGNKEEILDWVAREEAALDAEMPKTPSASVPNKPFAPG